MCDENGRWGCIEPVFEGDCDYYLIVNATNEVFDPKRAILVRMEPNIDNPSVWGEWSTSILDRSRFLLVVDDGHAFVNEWHIGKTYNELLTLSIEKDDDLSHSISAILSAKYKDPGQVKRVDFVKYLETRGISMHVFGSNKWEYTEYKGSLSSHCKENGLFPYKYHFNGENCEKQNYYTEKLVDCILSETLCFYWGCPNIREMIDPNAYVQLDLESFETDCEKIKDMLSNDEWSFRIESIRKEKKRILTSLQIFPKLESIILSLEREGCLPHV
jgi:hypothetical protein